MSMSEEQMYEAYLTITVTATYHENSLEYLCLQALRRDHEIITRPSHLEGKYHLCAMECGCFFKCLFTGMGDNVDKLPEVGQAVVLVHINPCDEHRSQTQIFLPEFH